jgi:hypothetical protein
MINFRILKAGLPDSPHSIASLASAIVVAALLLGAAPARAASPIKTRQASTTVPGPSGATRTVTVSCPKGTRALGGGYRLPNVNAGRSNITALLPYISRRVGQRRWKVAAYKVGNGTRPVALVAFVRCQGGIPPLVSAHARRNLVGTGGSGGFFSGNASAHCPSGSKPVSGGFQASVNGLSAGGDAPAEVILASYRRSATWRIKAIRIASGHGRLTAFAYCGTVGARNQSSDFGLKINTHSLRVRAPKCPRKWALASGGFVAPVMPSKDVAFALPISSGPLGTRRWSVTAFPEGDTGSAAVAPLRVISYCVRVAKSHN